MRVDVAPVDVAFAEKSAPDPSATIADTVVPSGKAVDVTVIPKSLFVKVPAVAVTDAEPDVEVAVTVLTF